MLLLGLGALVFACSDQAPDENLQKAFEIHVQSLEIRKSSGEELSLLKENLDPIAVSKYGRILDSLATLLEGWDNELIEVPGFEEDHHHGHHDHSYEEHVEDLNLTSAEHLEIQKHLMDEIKGLQKAIDQIQN